MKLYISADIEGICGITSWSETELGNRDSSPFMKQLTDDINTICDTAIEKGFTEIYVKDAHDTGRNLLPQSFGEKVKLIRGWSGHPYMMLEHIDDSFDCIAFVGFHSSASSSGNPISHTMNPRVVNEIIINNKLASEFLIFYYAALYIGIPVVLVTGDKLLCEEVNEINDSILTIVTKEGISTSTINENPNVVKKKIRKYSEEVFSQNNFSNFYRDLPKEFNIEITYRKHSDAYRNSFYKGAKLIASNKVQLITDDYFEVLRFLSFVVV